MYTQHGRVCSWTKMVRATSKMKLRGRWNATPPPPPHGTFDRKPVHTQGRSYRTTVFQIFLFSFPTKTGKAGVRTRHHTENKQYNDQKSERVTAAPNKKRHNQGKRHRGATPEQLAALRMVRHDTRRGGCSLWCDGAGRDRPMHRHI